MVRTTGSKNKPKTTASLLRQLSEAAQREGLELKPPDLIAKNTPPASSPTPTTDPPASGLAERAETLELKLDREEQDIYECGNCGASLGAAIPTCSECGRGLSW
ncbi:hypothetical protein CMI37_27145 [Candidatus Pacearchaeota archaeon]|nr:hypothetical protein [Candidatus Pacearchaeota archaeon]